MRSRRPVTIGLPMTATVNCTATAVAIFFVSFLASPLGDVGRAYADRFDLSVGSATRIMSSESVDALTEGPMPVFSMTGAVAVDSIHVPFFHRFYVEGSFEAGGVSGTTFQTLETHTTMFSVALGARLRRDMSERLSVQARANLGVSRVGVTMSDAFMDAPELGDAGYTGTAYLGGLSDFMMIQARRAGGGRFAMGLRAEFGYLAALPKTLRAQPDRSDVADGAILIPETAASLGDLDISAWSARFGLVGRF